MGADKRSLLVEHSEEDFFLHANAALLGLLDALHVVFEELGESVLIGVK